MIDVPARREARALLERVLRSDGITNYELEDSWPSSSNDASISAVLALLSPYFDAHPERTLQFQNFDADARDFISRAILFFDSEFEYQWPKSQFEWVSLGFVDSVLWKLLRRRRVSSRRKQNETRFRSAGEFHVFPFMSNDEYERAISRASLTEKLDRPDP